MVDGRLAVDIPGNDIGSDRRHTARRQSHPPERTAIGRDLIFMPIVMAAFVIADEAFEMGGALAYRP
jgi:hypothetical protein